MSRYALIRKRIAPFIFLLAMGLLIRDTCQRQDRARATVVLDLGEAAAKVRAVDATLHVNGDELSAFHRIAPDGMSIGPLRFEVSMPSRDGELRIDVNLGTSTRHIVRSIHAEEGATVTVPLGPDLR